MANNITVKDGLSANQVIKTTDTAGVHTPHQNIDSLPPTPIGANHIGAVLVDNGAGAAAVNIQDGGNSITIDAVSLPLPTGAATAAGQLPDGHNVAVIGTATVQDTARLIDNNAFTDGTSLVIPAGFVFDETPGTALTENDAAVARIDSKRAQVMVMEDATTRGRRAVLDSNGRQEIAILGGATVGSASVLTTAPGASEPGLVVRTLALLDGTLRTIVVGTVAHDSPVGSSSPVQVGVEARTTDGTPVSAAGDLVRPIADTLGKQVVLIGAVHDRHQRGTANFTTTTAADLIAAAGAGVRIVVTSVLVTNAHATVGTKVEIRDGTTVKVLAFAAAAGGGFALSDPHGLFISTANTAVTGRCATTGADVDITVSGYTIGN